jgi:hypothetical protein
LHKPMVVGTGLITLEENAFLTVGYSILPI